MEIRIVSISKWFRTIALMVLTLFSFLLSSCVDVEQYELYDDNLDEVVVLRNKKSKDDYTNGAIPGRRVFDNTCFMIAACRASSGRDNLQSYIEELDDFMRNKRGADLQQALPSNQTLGDSNRESVVAAIFGTSITSPTNGARHEEVYDLITSLTGHTYSYEALTSKSAIIDFITNHQNSNTVPRSIFGWEFGQKPKYSEEEYVIKTLISPTVSHVFNYNSKKSDLGLRDDAWGYLLNAPSGSYAGVFYPTY